MNRAVSVIALAVFATFGIVLLAHGRVAGGASMAGMNAAARAAGNRMPAARALGISLLQASWPAQITKVRVDGEGRHAIAGLVVSGVKFHRKLDTARFTAEVIALVDTAFSTSSVEEVDVWATTPLPTRPHEIVSGDLAEPTSRVVYAATVRRSERTSFAARLRAGNDVYWDPAWRATIASR